MNLGDLHKVWEIRTLKRKPKEEVARNILERIAKQVQPIMRNHKWRVKLLSEMCPKNGNLLGLNVGAGINVKLRLRRANRDEDFLPFHEVLDTMLHELCHNVHGPHNANFYKLWDELRKECEDLINGGISGSGQGFDLPGKRLGGSSRKPPLSSLRKAALTAAESRARRGTLLPSGPRKIGGDNSIKVALTPGQAAAMAAERRLQDNIWCGSEFWDDDKSEDEVTEPLQSSSEKGCCSGISCSSTIQGQDVTVESRKRNRESNDAASLRSSNGQKKPAFVDLVDDTSDNELLECLDRIPRKKSFQETPLKEASTSTSKSSSDQIPQYDQYNTWQCSVCTLLNSLLAPICELCRNPKPKDDNQKRCLWSCKFCTLENDMNMEKCVACEAWRYSYGAPVVTSAPNRGT